MNLQNLHSPSQLIKANSVLPKMDWLDLSELVQFDLRIKEIKTEFLGLDISCVDVFCLSHLYQPLSENLIFLASTGGFGGEIATKHEKALELDELIPPCPGLSSLSTRELAVRIYKHYSRYLRVDIELVKPLKEGEI